MTDPRTVPDMGPDTDRGSAPAGAGIRTCSPHLHRSEDGGGHPGQTPESAAGKPSENGPAPTGAPAPADGAADTDLTSPAGRPDIGPPLDVSTAVRAAGAPGGLVDGPRRDAWHDHGPTEGRVVLGDDAGVDEAIVGLNHRLEELRQDRDHLARQIHGYRDAQKKAAAADFRSREAIRLALEELRAPGRPPALAIADAAQTLANVLDGRPLAAKRDAAPATPAPAAALTRLGSLDEIRAHGARRTPAGGPLQPGVTL